MTPHNGHPVPGPRSRGPRIRGPRFRGPRFRGPRFRGPRARAAGPAALLLAPVLAWTLAGCAGGPEAAAGAAGGFGTLDYNQSWIKTTEFAGEYFADSAGYYREAGFADVNLISGGPSGTSSESMVLSGSALVGTTTPIAAGSMAAGEGAPLKVIGAKFQKNPFAVYSLADDPIASPRDMVGKRIGVAAGTNEILFEALLEVNGIEPSEVEKVPVQFDPQPLMNGEVDGQIGFVTNEAITVGLEGFDVASMPFADHGLPFVAGAFVTTEENIETRRDELKGFLAATVRGWKDALADPDESARLAYEVYGSDLGLNPAKEKRQAATQNELVVSEETEENGLFTISDELAAANVEVLRLAGYEISAGELFDNSLLEEVYAENPELKE